MGRPPLPAAAPLFAALGDETRLRLVVRLREDGPLSIAELTAGTSVTRQAVTKHLRVLAGAGLARGRQAGRESIWELEPQALLDARDYLEQVSTQWDVALGRLRRLVETDEQEGDPADSAGRTRIVLP